MANFNLPTNIAAGGTTSGHKAHTDTVHSVVDKMDTTVLTPTSGQIMKYNGTGWAPAAEAGSGSALTNTADKIYFVSTAGSDSNNGRSWGTAFLTIGAAVTALGGPGKIFMGAGTYSYTAGSFPEIGNNVEIIGAGPYSTFISLSSNGILLDYTSSNDLTFRDLCFTFASSSITGTLFKASNCFKHIFWNVRFLGQDVTGQIGRWELDNTGDCHYAKCKWENLGVGFKTVTSISYINHSQFSSNLTAFYGGDPTGVDNRGGIVCMNTGFLGSGDYYIDIDGGGLNFFFSNVWFDGSATTAVKVGKADGTLGPRMCSFSRIPSMFGLVTSMVLYKATRMDLDAIQWHHGGGTPPTELSIPVPANVGRGSIRNCRSNQSQKMESLVPHQWDGYAGYVAMDSDKTQVLESAQLCDIGTQRSWKRVQVSINGRLSGDAQSVITYPAAFETSQFAKTFDNTAFSGMTVGQTSLTIPTANAGSGLIIIEGR